MRKQSLIDRNVAKVGDTLAYRFLDFSRAHADLVELTWAQLDVRMRAIAARIQQSVSRGRRVAASGGMSPMVDISAHVNCE